MCRICGWISSNFKDGNRINYDKLRTAREEFRKHVLDSHKVSFHPPETQVDVVVMSGERAREIRTVKKK